MSIGRHRGRRLRRGRLRGRHGVGCFGVGRLRDRRHGHGRVRGLGIGGLGVRGRLLASVVHALVGADVLGDRVALVVLLLERGQRLIEIALVLVLGCGLQVVGGIERALDAGDVVLVVGLQVLRRLQLVELVEPVAHDVTSILRDVGPAVVVVGGLGTLEVIEVVVDRGADVLERPDVVPVGQCVAAVSAAAGQQRQHGDRADERELLH